MKYLILFVLFLMPSLAFGQEAPKKLTLPEEVAKVADMRMEITIRQGDKVWRVLVPSNNSSEGLTALKSALSDAKIVFASKAENEKAKAHGGKHAVLSLFGGNYILIPQK